MPVYFRGYLQGSPFRDDRISIYILNFWCDIHFFMLLNEAAKKSLDHTLLE